MNEVKKYIKARNNKVISQEEMINCLCRADVDAVEQAYFDGLLRSSEYFLVVDKMLKNHQP